MNETLAKLRNLPEGKKKYIVWGITIFVGILLLIWWIPRVGEKLQDVGKSDFAEELSLPELKEQLESIPPIEFPTVSIPEEGEEQVDSSEETTSSLIF